LHCHDPTISLLAYEKQGVKFDSEKRNPEFEKAVGCPGITKLLIDL
jgi:hypothetical protein